MSYKIVKCAEIKCDQCGKTASVDSHYLFNRSMDGMGNEMHIDANWYTHNDWKTLKRNPLDFCSEECRKYWMEEL